MITMTSITAIVNTFVLPLDSSSVVDIQLCVNVSYVAVFVSIFIKPVLIVGYAG